MDYNAKADSNLFGGIKNQIRYQPKLTFINFEFASRDGIYI